MARRRGAVKDYKSEAELCADFRAWLEDHAGWIVYNETAGWDMLAVFNGRLQVGIQAKLRPTFHLIEQALEGVRYTCEARGCDGAGPHYRAVLIPFADSDVVSVLRRLRVICLTPCLPDWNEERDGIELTFGWREWAHHRANPFDPDRGLGVIPQPEWQWAADKPERLPEFVPDTPAGVPCPKILSPWKIRMLRVVVIAHVRGHVTAAEAREFKIDLAPWTWEQNPERSRFIRLTKGVYKIGPAMTYHTDFPQTFEKLVAEYQLKVIADGIERPPAETCNVPGSCPAPAPAPAGKGKRKASARKAAAPRG